VVSRAADMAKQRDLDSCSTGRKKKWLTGGAHMSAGKEIEGATTGMYKPEEKVPFGECTKASWANWAERGRWRPMGSWARFRGRFKMEIGFQISNEFRFWQDFEKFYMEI
jgi:hypothetical protein